MTDIKELNERIQRVSAFVDMLQMEIGKVIIGQKAMVERLLIGLLSNGHVLLEGVPGLAKTLSINTLASAIQAKFQRIQFTPDLLPADVIGTMIYNQKTGDFTVRKGPIFSNFILGLGEDDACVRDGVTRLAAMGVIPILRPVIERLGYSVD